MPKEQGRKAIATNRKARHDYSIVDTYECGVVLMGTEVKSLRAGRASLVDAFATVDDGEVWLRGLHITEYEMGTWTNHEPRRNRKSSRWFAETLRSLMRNSPRRWKVWPMHGCGKAYGRAIASRCT